jgi:Uma2 family endonuclease
MAKKKWAFTCLCWSCLRIFDVPAGLFLQGDPVCFCGSSHIAANQESRELMDDLTIWFEHENPKPFTSPDGRVVVQWSKVAGAIYECASVEKAN